MKDKDYKGGPVAAAFTLDNENSEILQVSISNSATESLRSPVTECMRHTDWNKMQEMRVELYEFPSLDPIPEINAENAEHYYADKLQPLVKEMGIEPTAVIHNTEVLYSMLNDVPIEVGKPDKAIRLRSDFAEQCKTFPDRIFDLIGTRALIKMPDGDEIRIGVAAGIGITLKVPKPPRHVPSVPSENGPKHGV